MYHNFDPLKLISRSGLELFTLIMHGVFRQFLVEYQIGHQNGKKGKMLPLQTNPVLNFSRVNIDQQIVQEQLLLYARNIVIWKHAYLKQQKTKIITLDSKRQCTGKKLKLNVKARLKIRFV